jgi:TRAP-type uncharacterized transport system substrate-binding protein
MKNLVLLALAASLVACGAEDTTTPAPEAPEAPVVDATGGPCGDGRELGPNEVCP